jgi:hypothetical protein
MQLSDIRLKIAPIAYKKDRFGKVRLTGGEHVQMTPEENPKGAWLHFERRDVQPGQTFLPMYANGTVGEARKFPDGQKQRVAMILHHPSGETIETHFFGPDGIPVAKHPLEEE